MALKTLPELIRERLPFLTDTEYADLVPSWILQVVYELQEPLGKPIETVESVEDPLVYSPLEKLLLADYTAHALLGRETLRAVAGTAGVAAPVQKVLKKAKADVAEAEFEILKPADAGGLKLSATDLMGTLKAAACRKARQLKVTLPLCTSVVEGTVEFPLVVIY